jgi:hypothetical protein
VDARTTHLSAFEGSAVAELHVPCTFDFNLAATKYFYSLEDGEVPLRLLFSGTVFHASPDGALLASPVPWSSELAASFPATLWKDLIAQHHPGGAVLRLEPQVFDRLYRYKVSRGIPTWEGALEQLLARVESSTVEGGAA